MLDLLRKIIPTPLFQLGQPIYHYVLSFLGALMYGFPARKLKIVGVTGTKGKTTTTEIINAILEEAGIRTAIAGTLRFKVAGKSEPNMFKMTMPGRFVMQKFLREAANSACEWVIVEMTSEGVKQFRHKWMFPNALVFTNIAPEHIESHGSFEKYLEAKLKLADELHKSSKPKKIMVANIDSTHGQKFIDRAQVESCPFSLKDAEPWNANEDVTFFTFKGLRIHSPLRGVFNIYNLLSGATFAHAIGISASIIDEAIGKLHMIRGRVEYVRLPDDHPKRSLQQFDAIVDYAHTVESLTELYKTFHKHRKICVLGNTGGGRDKWKRKEMGNVANNYCDEIILTNEDPYDEDPLEILKPMKEAMVDKPFEVIVERRMAIRAALRKAYQFTNSNNKERVAVLITGKGTDPYIMGPRGTRQRWDDAEVVREELELLLKN